MISIEGVNALSEEVTDVVQGKKIQVVDFGRGETQMKTKTDPSDCRRNADIVSVVVRVYPGS
jgi:hypothetical protein